MRSCAVIRFVTSTSPGWVWVRRCLPMAMCALLAMASSCGYAVEAPVIKPAGGAYDHPVTVVMKSTPKEADIRYTIDGTAITPAASLYTHPFQIATTTTVRAQAFLDGVPSAVTVVTYTITGVQNVGATPVFSPAPGTFATPVSVTISSATSGAVLHYTLDGTEPTAVSPVYASPLPVSANTTIRARGFAYGYFAGGVAVGVYDFQAARPTANPLCRKTTGPQ